jgi:aconitase B
MVIAQGKVREANKERDEANEDLHKQLVQFDQLFDEAEKIRIERDEAREVLKRIAHASMSARHKEEDYAEWEKAVESLQGICEEKNFINE